MFKASFYKEKNTKLKLDMTTEKQQFYSDALFYNQLQNILDFCLIVLFKWNNILYA